MGCGAVEEGGRADGVEEALDGGDEVLCGDRVCYIEARIRRRSERIAWWPGEVRDKGSRLA